MADLATAQAQPISVDSKLTPSSKESQSGRNGLTELPNPLPPPTPQPKFSPGNWTLVLLSVVLIGVCVMVQSNGRKHQIADFFQRKTVPTHILKNGNLGKILQKLNLVQRVPSTPSSDDNAGRFPGKNRPQPPGKFSFTLGTGVQRGDNLIISEVQSGNGGELLDRDGHCPDWIELLNPTSFTIDVTGWYMTDNPKNLTRWKFPERLVEPGERLVIFADGKDSYDDQELHTNFRLAKSGTYLALVKPDKVTVEQEVRFGTGNNHHGISFGFQGNKSFPFRSPTPFADNSQPATGLTSKVLASHDSCLFEDSFLVSLSCKDPGVSIRYTLDGSHPDSTNGRLYTSPLRVEKTTIIRALAELPSQIPSTPITRSYLQITDLIGQSARPSGFPLKWKKTLADYEMDPRITVPFTKEIKSALRHLPMVSIVGDVEEIFGNKGIYSKTKSRGFDWEIPANAELLKFGDEPGFRVNCGIRIAGNESRRPSWKKHSIRLNFRGRYGHSTLTFPLFDQPGTNRFSTLMLRGTDDSWMSYDRQVRENAQYIRDQWARDTELAMGRLSARGKFVHVCLNGLYWGIYNLIERPDDEFFAHQIGGHPTDFITVRTRGRDLEADDVGQDMWDSICKLAWKDLRKAENYNAIGKRLDLVGLTDYILIHLYAGNEDWALTNGNNLRAYYQKEPVSKMRFVVWDFDSTFASGWDNNSIDFVAFDFENNDIKSMQHIVKRLFQNHQFRQLLTERLDHWTKSGEPLHDDVARRRYQELLHRIEPALIAESARWGDVRTDDPYTPNGTWRKQGERIVQHWFTDRGNKVRTYLEQKKSK